MSLCFCEHQARRVKFQEEANFELNCEGTDRPMSERTFRSSAIWCCALGPNEESSLLTRWLTESELRSSLLYLIAGLSVSRSVRGALTHALDSAALLIVPAGAKSNNTPALVYRNSGVTQGTYHIGPFATNTNHRPTNRPRAHTSSLMRF
jgi:hypothetical protein